MAKKRAPGFRISGRVRSALFSLKVYRGDGMALLAMDWKKGTPPNDFVGFGIEYKEPNGKRYYALKNRLAFTDDKGKIIPNRQSTLLSPIQKFRWVHFPRNAEMLGRFEYRVTPVFMNDKEELSYGDAQLARIVLSRETFEGQLNVSFTRGFVSSQSFVDYYLDKGEISTLLPSLASEGLTFTPTHVQTDQALSWMGFEARSAILELLDKAIADKKAQVRVIAYDLSLPEVVSRLEQLGDRLKIIIDDDHVHRKVTSGETQSEKILAASAGKSHVKRQHMGSLQHNKVIVVDGPDIKAAVCGSTNFSWRGFYVQANNAVIIQGADSIKPFLEAFEDYWNNETPGTFGKTGSANWKDLKLEGIDAKISFSPHSKENAILDEIGEDLEKNIRSNLFFSLAFLYQTPGPILDAINKASNSDKLFVYGISDKKVGGIELLKPDGNIAPVSPSALSENVPEPFKSEPTGGGGARMHHKFVVVDFDKPSARVYLGSYNFSNAADRKNGENLLLIRDKRVATAYMIEAIRLFDHYHFRTAQQSAKTAKRQLALQKPPKTATDLAWWDEDYKNKRKIKDRKMFG